MVAVQAVGCTPIALAFETGEEEVSTWDCPVETASSSISDALRGYPEDGTRTLSVVRRSGGKAIAVSEEETQAAMVDLAKSEGLFVEPGAAGVVAAYRKLVEGGIIEERDHGASPHGARPEGSRLPCRDAKVRFNCRGARGGWAR